MTQTPYHHRQVPYLFIATRTQSSHPLCFLEVSFLPHTAINLVPLNPKASFTPYTSSIFHPFVSSSHSPRLSPFYPSVFILSSHSYSDLHKEWGLLMVDGEEANLYICEIPQANLNNLIDESVERNHEYGLVIQDPTKIPRSPVFTLQPEDIIFDLARREVINYISVTCLGGLMQTVYIFVVSTRHLYNPRN